MTVLQGHISKLRDNNQVQDPSTNIWISSTGSFSNLFFQRNATLPMQVQVGTSPVFQRIAQRYVLKAISVIIVFYYIYLIVQPRQKNYRPYPRLAFFRGRDLATVTCVQFPSFTYFIQYICVTRYYGVLVLLHVWQLQTLCVGSLSSFLRIRHLLCIPTLWCRLVVWSTLYKSCRSLSCFFRSTVFYP